MQIGRRHAIKKPIRHEPFADRHALIQPTSDTWQKPATAFDTIMPNQRMTLKTSSSGSRVHVKRLQPTRSLNIRTATLAIKKLRPEVLSLQPERTLGLCEILRGSAVILHHRRPM